MKQENPEHPTKKIVKDQSGQTFIEFVLLLASIVIIAYSFMRLTNGGIRDRWTKMAQMVLDDETQTLSPR